jgi:glycosyltransferase involved in cell wall biosynthesis
VSHCCAESLRLRPTFANSDKIRYVYNGVAVPQKDESAPLDLRLRLSIGNAPLCLMLATYEQRKGHAFLFEAFRSVNELYPQAHLAICGDGTKAEREVVERLRVLVAPDANIHLLEFIPAGSKLIRQADILIVASQEWESFGWTVIEAMALGVPVVSTNSGGLAEVVGPNGVAGFAVDPQDVDSFAACISELISQPQRRDEMGAAGRRRVVEHFKVEDMAMKYAQMVRSTLDEDEI